jgi:UDP-N-acetylmuramoyl-L-alanyl-D-glutamate--2,6-diaminopimelate ligase
VKRLSEILEGVTVEQIKGNLDLMISSLEFDSRKVEDGCCFFAVRGTRVDGHHFILDAIRNGATTIVCEKMPDPVRDGITYIRVASSSHALGEIACNYFENPSGRLKLIGITGTNGKTTTANLVYRVLRKYDKNAGLISTIGNFIGDQDSETTHTTPDAMPLWKSVLMP